MSILDGIFSAIWDTIPGIVIVLLLMAVFAVGCGKAIAHGATEPPVPAWGPTARKAQRSPHLSAAQRSAARPVPGRSRSPRAASDEFSGALCPAPAEPDAPAGRRHGLARVEELRDGKFRAHCSCRKGISHSLDSHLACEAWVLIHERDVTDLEASIEAFAPGASR